MSCMEELADAEEDPVLAQSNEQPLCINLWSSMLAPELSMPPRAKNKQLPSPSFEFTVASRLVG